MPCIDQRDDNVIVNTYYGSHTACAWCVACVTMALRVRGGVCARACMPLCVRVRVRWLRAVVWEDGGDAVHGRAVMPWAAHNKVIPNNVITASV